MTNTTIPLFWRIFAFFYAIPFPILLYYSTSDAYSLELLKNKNPYLAFGLLGLSIVLWLVLFVLFIKKYFISLFDFKRNIEKIKISGVLREAKILNAKIISKPNSKFPKCELELSFKNLSNTEIKHKTVAIDTKPQENRFEKGKNLNLVIDSHLKHPPYFTLADSNCSIGLSHVILKTLVFVINVCVVVFYYFYAYQTEGFGMSWLFMSVLHPLITCPISSLLVLSIIRLIIVSTSRQKNGVGHDEIFLKLKGIKTTATILSANETGSYVNEQPVVAFRVQFTDEKNQMQQSTIRKIVKLINLHKTSQTKAEIFYLPDNPKTVAFAADL
nr:hypothetical protein [uncultured Flavobacterium sp.]